MASHVFTYGSLMFAPVWQRVVGGAYRSAPAWLDGYARHALADDAYPGMIEAAGSRVDGLVYFDVTDADLARLDAFEGDEYRRIAVSLTLREAAPDGSPGPAGSAGSLPDAEPTRRLSAQTYLFTAVHRLAPHAWEPGRFALAGFMATYCRDKLGD
jgi:gamma-glutamylcyclotransferase (GGCT)/AIG2-like uncharacterized protein YtfP